MTEVKTAEAGLVKKVEDALYRLHANARRDLDVATEIAPELVRRESRIEFFLKVERGDAEKAALRLAKYWQARRQVFADRWLLPMTQTGNGALNRDDIELLRTGFLMLVPRPSGGSVALYDEGRLTRSPRHGLTRCVFYLQSVYPEESLSITFIHVVTSAKRPPLDLDPSRWQIFHSSMPIKVVQIWVAQAYEPGKQELIDFLAYQLFVGTSYKSRFQLNRIAESSVNGTLKALQAKGFEEECLPHSLGGQYDYKALNEWVRMRLSLEEVMNATPASCYRPSTIPQVAAITAVRQRGILSRACADRVRHRMQGAASAEALEREVTRERNAMYSRRSCEKRKLEKVALENQVELLQAQNEKIRIQNGYLEVFLEEAQRVVKLHTSRVE